MALFGRAEENKEAEHSETLIGASVKVEGKFVGRGNVVIEGRLVGSLKTDGNLHITQTATVTADIEAKNVVIAGQVHGNVKANERLDLLETAKLVGNVEAKILSVAANAAFNGKSTMSVPSSPENPSPISPPSNIRERLAKNNVKSLRKPEKP